MQGAGIRHALVVCCQTCKTCTGNAVVPRSCAMHLCYATVPCTYAMHLCHAAVPRIIAMQLCHAFTLRTCAMQLCHAIMPCSWPMPLCHADIQTQSQVTLQHLPTTPFSARTPAHIYTHTTSHCLQPIRPQHTTRLVDTTNADCTGGPTPPTFACQHIFAWRCQGPQGSDTQRWQRHKS